MIGFCWKVPLIGLLNYEMVFFPVLNVRLN